MGGDIFVGVRYKDKNGKIVEHLSHRWTNIMPGFTVEPTFIDQGERFDAFLEWAKETNEYPQSILIHKIECGEYGVIFFDFIKKVIFSRNNYFAPGSIIIGTTYLDVEEDIEQLEELIKRGYIGEIYDDYPLPRDKTHKSLPIDTFIETVRKQLQEGKRFLYFAWVNKNFPFKIDHKTDHSPDVKKVKAWLEKNGWTSEIDEKSFIE